MNKAIFLDKDGVFVEDSGFVHKMKDLQFIPGTTEALQKLAGTDYKIIVISNAPVVGRGICTEDEFMAFSAEYRAMLVSDGARIDDAYYCFHHPTKGIGEYAGECDCRKPASGMLKAAIEKYDIDAGSSYMVGDKRSDVSAGADVGCQTILVETGCGGRGGEGCDVHADHTTANLLSAVDYILSR